MFRSLFQKWGNDYENVAPVIIFVLKKGGNGLSDKIVAYIGVEAFDIILYQAQILASLEKKVLVMDYSKDQALSKAFPQVKGIEYSKTPFTYRHVDYAAIPITESLLADYDMILISYGFIAPEEIHRRERIVCVADFHSHNIDKVQRYYEYGIKNIWLVVRNALNTKFSPITLLNNQGIKINMDDYFQIELNDIDIENAVLCQYNHVYSFTKISSDMRNFLMSITKKLFSSLTDKEIKLAYKNARKGE